MKRWLPYLYTALGAVAGLLSSSAVARACTDLGTSPKQMTCVYSDGSFWIHDWYACNVGAHIGQTNEQAYDEGFVQACINCRNNDTCFANTMITYGGWCCCNCS